MFFGDQARRTDEEVAAEAVPPISAKGSGGSGIHDSSNCLRLGRSNDATSNLRISYGMQYPCPAHYSVRFINVKQGSSPCRG